MFDKNDIVVFVCTFKNSFSMYKVNDWKKMVENKKLMFVLVFVVRMEYEKKTCIFINNEKNGDQFSLIFYFYSIDLHKGHINSEFQNTPKIFFTLVFGVIFHSEVNLIFCFTYGDY